MNIVMSYIDYKMADLSERERFSFTRSQTEEIYGKLKEDSRIKGAVLIATCNRTELYLSLKEAEKLNAFDMLCKSMGISGIDYFHLSKSLAGDDAIRHLCKVAAGAESQIWGDGQIVTQVREAVRHARECKASDTFLNVIFRNCISAGKKIKTNVRFRIHDDSTAKKAVAKLAVNPAIKKVLVIGNGMIGRLVARNLVAEGIETVMTVRQYKYGEIVIPDGVKKVMYANRYKEMASCDGVISATSSPHFTVHYEDAVLMDSLPGTFIDMAVPRDIDPRVESELNAKCYNIDQISQGTKEELKDEQLAQMECYIDKYLERIHHWYEFRENMEKKIYVIGIGPGGSQYMTPQAKQLIKDSDVVVGYTVYVDLVRDLCEGKVVRDTAMKKEVDRCKIALDYAVKGKTVAFVCSGDAGVYGMAGLMSEVAVERPDVEVITIPGITAACSGAAVLGAPLIHDFAVISLSDLLTPWDTIEKRINMAADADFVICMYNPKSKKRRDYIDKAADMISKYKSWDTPCGYVKNIGRPGEDGVVCTLKDLKENDEIDMFTTVFVGNSSTKVINGKLVTPRGYKGV